MPGRKPVLGLGRLGTTHDGIVLVEGLFDWLTLAQWSIPACAALGTQGMDRVAAALRGCPRVFLAFDSDDAGREATQRLQALLGRRAAPVTLPEGIGDVAELASQPDGRALFLRQLEHAARRARCAVARDRTPRRQSEGGRMGATRRGETRQRAAAWSPHRR